MNIAFRCLSTYFNQVVDPNCFNSTLLYPPELSDIPATLGSAEHIVYLLQYLPPGQVSNENQTMLARRLLLGMRTQLLVQSARFWTTAGINPTLMKIARAAAETTAKDWPGQVIDLRSGQTMNLQTSGAYDSFRHALATIEDNGSDSPLGKAIATSRYGHNNPRLGQSPYRGGFPAMLGRSRGERTHFSPAAWVELADEWPSWVLGNEEPQEVAKARKLWSAVSERVVKALEVGGYEAPADAFDNHALPQWYLLYIAQFGVEGLDSAGLALAFHFLARQQLWDLPIGIGFTGAWDTRGRLAAVSGIANKLHAAREAGIFVLFACARQSEDTGTVVGSGVDLVLLSEGLTLDEVRKHVSNVCLRRGLCCNPFTNRPRILDRYRVEPYAGTHLPEEMITPDIWLGEPNYQLIRSGLGWHEPVQVVGVKQSGKTLLVAEALRDEGFAGQLASAIAPGEKVVLLLLDLADVSTSQALNRRFMRTFPYTKATDGFDRALDSSLEEIGSQPDDRENLLQQFYTWSRGRRLLLVIDNADVLLDWKEGINDLKTLLPTSTRKIATCVLITADGRVDPVAIGYRAGSVVYPPENLHRQELIEQWARVLPTYSEYAERAADLILSKHLKPAQVCELLRECQQEAQRNRLTLERVGKLAERKEFVSQQMALDCFQETLQELSLSDTDTQAARRSMLVTAIFGPVPLPEAVFLRAGCDERLVEHLQHQAWLRSPQPQLLQLDRYLADALRTQWHDDACPWIGHETALTFALRDTVQAMVDGGTIAGLPIVDVLETTRNWLSKLLTQLRNSTLRPAIKQFHTELADRMLPEACDDPVLPVTAQELGELPSVALGQAGLHTLVGRLVAFSRVAADPARISELIGHIESTLVDVRQPLSVDQIRRIDYALWQTTRLQIPVHDLFELRTAVIHHLGQRSHYDWAWLKAATYFCLHTLAWSRSAYCEGPDIDWYRQVFGQAESFAERFPPDPTSNHGRIDQLNLKARLLDLSLGDEDRQERLLEACRSLHEMVELPGGARPWYVKRLIRAACQFVREQEYGQEVEEVRRWVETAVDSVGGPEDLLGALSEFLLEVSRTLQDGDKRLQLLSDIAARLLSVLPGCSVETNPESWGMLLARLEDILSERSQFLQELGRPDKDGLLEKTLRICTRAPKDKRSARCWLTYIRLLQRAAAKEAEFSFSNETEDTQTWILTPELHAAFQDAKTAVDKARHEGLRVPSDLRLLLLRLQWCERGYSLRSAVEAISARKKRAKPADICYADLPDDEKLHGLTSVYQCRNDDLGRLLTECPSPAIIIEQAHLAEQYNKEVVLVTNKPLQGRPVDLTEPLARLEEGGRRWPQDTRLLSARAAMYRTSWQLAEAEKLYEALRRRERYGPFRRRATLALCKCLLTQLTFLVPLEFSGRPAKLAKLRESLDYLRPWPDFASEVAALNVRYHIEAGKVDTLGGLDGVFDAVVGRDKPYAEQLQVFLHSELVQAEEESCRNVLQALREDCTDLMVLRTLGCAYYRWSEVIEPGLDKLMRAYKAFDAVRLLEKSWRRDNKATVATCIDLGLVGLAAIKLTRTALPFGPFLPESYTNWFNFTESKLQSAHDRSVGRCLETTKGYLADLRGLKRLILGR